MLCNNLTLSNFRIFISFYYISCFIFFDRLHWLTVLDTSVFFSSILYLWLYVSWQLRTKDFFKYCHELILILILLCISYRFNLDELDGLLQSRLDSNKIALTSERFLQLISAIGLFSFSFCTLPISRTLTSPNSHFNFLYLYYVLFTFPPFLIFLPFLLFLIF